MSAVRLLPFSIHEAVEYVAGVFAILAPFVFGFEDTNAFPVFIGLGVVILATAILSAKPLGVVGVLPTAVHAALDYVLVLFLLVAPFLLGFSDESVPTTISILLGVAHLVITLVTSFPVPDEAAQQ